jgi:hypothetical protein
VLYVFDAALAAVCVRLTSVPYGISGISNFRPQFPIAYTSCIEVRWDPCFEALLGDGLAVRSTREFILNDDRSDRSRCAITIHEEFACGPPAWLTP